MKALLTSALFVAQILTSSSFAQQGGVPTNETLAQRIGSAVRTEVGLCDTSNHHLTCSITERNEAKAGSGVALVMYSPAYARLSIAVAVTDRRSGKRIWSSTVHAIGRTTLEEALDDAVEQITAQVADAVPPASPDLPLNVIAVRHR